MVYSFSFFVSSKNLLTYRKWPIGVDCQATRPLELEEVYHGFYSVPSPANVHWQEPLWLLTLASVGGGVNMLMSFLHCSFCSERFFFDCYSKAKAEEPRLSNSPSIGRQTTVKRAFFHVFGWINALPWHLFHLQCMKMFAVQDLFHWTWRRWSPFK